MNRHDAAHGFRISFSQKVDNHEVVVVGPFRYRIPFVLQLKGFLNGLIHHRQKMIEEPVVGCPNQGIVKSDFPLDDFFIVEVMGELFLGGFHQADNLFNLFIRRPLTGQSGRGGLNNQPCFVEVFQGDLLFIEGGNGIGLLVFSFRDEGSLSALNLKQSFCDQDSDGFPQSGSADPQLQ